MSVVVLVCIAGDCWWFFVMIFLYFCSNFVVLFLLLWWFLLYHLSAGRKFWLVDEYCWWLLVILCHFLLLHFWVIFCIFFYILLVLVIHIGWFCSWLLVIFGNVLWFSGLPIILQFKIRLAGIEEDEDLLTACVSDVRSLNDSRISRF